jgi:hypothetical protein
MYPYTEKELMDVHKMKYPRELSDSDIKQNAQHYSYHKGKNYADYKSGMSAIGGITGGLAGGSLGYALSGKLFKVKQRNQIKQIILSSDSPEDCIEKLKQLGTSLALNYCATVNKVYQKYPNGWKGRIANSIKIRYVAAQTVGTLGGTYAVNTLGYLAGNKLGQHMSNTYADKLINKIDSTMKDPGPVPINFWAPDKHQHPNIFDV